MTYLKKKIIKYYYFEDRDDNMIFLIPIQLKKINGTGCNWYEKFL